MTEGHVGGYVRERKRVWRERDRERNEVERKVLLWRRKEEVVYCGTKKDGEAVYTYKYYSGQGINNYVVIINKYINPLKRV